MEGKGWSLVCCGIQGSSIYLHYGTPNQAHLQKDIYAPVPRICECHLVWQREFAVVIKEGLAMGRYGLGLWEWALSHHKPPFKEKADVRRSEKECEAGSRGQRERGLEEAGLLALKMEEEATSQGIWWLPEAREGREWILLQVSKKEPTLPTP